MEICLKEKPPLRDIGGERLVSCHLPDDFAFPPIVHPTDGGRATSGPIRAPDGPRLRPDIDAAENPPSGRTMGAALFGTPEKGPSGSRRHDRSTAPRVMMGTPRPDRRGT